LSATSLRKGFTVSQSKTTTSGTHAEGKTGLKDSASRSQFRPNESTAEEGEIPENFRFRSIKELKVAPSMRPAKGTVDDRATLSRITVPRVSEAGETVCFGGKGMSGSPNDLLAIWADSVIGFSRLGLTNKASQRPSVRK